MDDKGFHHGYIGLALLLTGFIMTVFTQVNQGVNDVITSLGLVIFFDDYYQHRRQRVEPDYRSLLNQIYGRTLYKVPIIRKINTFFDKLLQS